MTASSKPRLTRIAQINLHCAKRASDNISRVITREGVGITLIQEPWAPHGPVLGISAPNCKVIWDVNSKVPRTCIVINSNIPHICLSEYLTRDLVPIELNLEFKGSRKRVVVASAYFAGDREIPLEEVRKLINHCAKNNLPLLIGCDANAHNTSWGSSDNNPRGEYLLEYLCRANLNVLNVGNTPTFRTRVREEVLDITFCSMSLTSSISRWRVSNETSFSDHCIIRFEIIASAGPRVQSRNPRNTDWDNFRIKLADILPSSERISNHLQLEDTVSSVNSSIISAYSENCKPRCKKSGGDVPW